MKSTLGRGDCCEHWIQPLFTLDHGAAYFSLPAGPRMMTNTPAWYTAHVVPLLTLNSPHQSHMFPITMSVCGYNRKPGAAAPEQILTP